MNQQAVMVRGQNSNFKDPNQKTLIPQIHYIRAPRVWLIWGAVPYQRCKPPNRIQIVVGEIRTLNRYVEFQEHSGPIGYIGCMTHIVLLKEQQVF